MIKPSITIEKSQWIFVLTAMLAFILLGFAHKGLYTNMNLPGTPVKVTTSPVSLVTKPIEIPMTGLTESRKAAVIRAPLSGIIVEVSVTDGQMVEAGQQLVTVKGVMPIVKPAANPQQQNAATESSPNQDAQTAYDVLVKKYEQYEKLYQLGAVPKRQVEDLAAQVEAAKASLSAPAAPMQPMAGMDMPSDGTSREMSIPLAAPIAGKITEITAANQGQAQAGQALMVVDTEGDIRVVVHVAQQDLYLLHTGSLANITQENNPSQILKGQVEGIYPEIGPKSNVFVVYFRINGAAAILPPGIKVNVSALMDESVPVAAVPKQAVINEQGASYLYLASNGKAIRQEVTAGAMLGDYIEILSELPAEAAVITDNLPSLKDGSPIQLQ